VFERAKTLHVLDHAATVIGSSEKSKEAMFVTPQNTQTKRKERNKERNTV
jgi:hypothetical protein